MTQNSISIPSCAQTPKNPRKMSKTPPYSGLGAKPFLGSGLGAKPFLAPPPAKADIATAILTNVIEHLVLLLPPNKHAFTAKAVWADFEFLRPLLSQVADNTDASWWLLDSGASTSVLAESNLSAFRSVLQDSEGLGSYKAANGSSVNMSGTAEIGVQMHMSGTSGDDWCWKKARLNVLVGSIRHNI